MGRGLILFELLGVLVGGYELNEFYECADVA